MQALDEVLIALRRVIRATDLHSKYLVKTTGLTAPQILLLLSIRNKGPVTIGELANAISLSQATVTIIMDRLEGRGLVYRQRSDKDKRKVHAFLTDEGQAILENAPTPLQENFSKRFMQLEDWEQAMILASLQRVASMMDAQDLDAAPVLEVGGLEPTDGPN